jgi:hypothetical protein
MKCQKNIPDCCDAVKQTVRMPMVIDILMKIAIARKMMMGCGN